MQGQRRWKDNSIVYNFCVDTMVKFRIMKEHGVFLRWNCPRKLQGPNTARNTAVFMEHGVFHMEHAVSHPQTGFQVLFLLQHGPEAYKYPRDPQGRDILHYTHIFELLERARVPERRLKREDQPQLAKGKSSSRRLGFPWRTCRLLRFFFSSLVIYFPEPWVAKLSVLFGWDEALAKLCMDDLICYRGLFRLMMRSS